jgi:hypothetical protein
MSDVDIVKQIAKLQADVDRLQRMQTPSTIWYTYTSTVTGSTGSAGTYAETVLRSRYRTFNHLCHVQVSKIITNVGSWTGNFQVARPIAAVNNSLFMENGKIVPSGGLASKANIAGSNSSLFVWHSSWNITTLPWGGAGVVVNDWIFIDSIYEI